MESVLPFLTRDINSSFSAFMETWLLWHRLAHQEGQSFKIWRYIIGLKGGHEMMRIPIVELRVERSRSAECLREQLLTAEKAAEWMGGIIGDSCREHVATVCFDACLRHASIS